MIKEYKFLEVGEKNGFRQFSDELEDDENIYFHGTAEANFENIKLQGFQPRDGGNLETISLAKNSSTALRYACEARNKIFPNGMIILVDISDISPEKIKDFGKSVIHLNSIFQPEIIGYCVIPMSYLFK